MGATGDERTTCLPSFFGLFAAASWGGGDFVGGLASRRASVYQAAVYGEAFGVVLLLAAIPFIHEPAMPWTLWILDMIAGAIMHRADDLLQCPGRGRYERRRAGLGFDDGWPTGNRYGIDPRPTQSDHLGRLCLGVACRLAGFTERRVVEKSACPPRRRAHAADRGAVVAPISF